MLGTQGWEGVWRGQGGDSTGHSKPGKRPSPTPINNCVCILCCLGCDGEEERGTPSSGDTLPATLPLLYLGGRGMGCPPPRRQVSTSLLKITRGGRVGVKGRGTGLSQTPVLTSLSGSLSVCLSVPLPPLLGSGPFSPGICLLSLGLCLLSGFLSPSFLWTLSPFPLCFCAFHPSPFVCHYSLSFSNVILFPNHTYLRVV